LQQYLHTNKLSITTS